MMCGREKLRIGREDGDFAKFIFEEYTKHDVKWSTVKTMPFPLTMREFLSRTLCFKESTGDLVVVSEPLPDEARVDYGANLKAVRGKGTAILRAKPINGDTQCEGTSTSTESSVQATAASPVN
jgi:hypothetical protein